MNKSAIQLSNKSSLTSSLDTRVSEISLGNELDIEADANFIRAIESIKQQIVVVGKSIIQIERLSNEAMFAPNRHRYQTILQMHDHYTQATYALLGKAISELQVLALANSSRKLANYDHATRLECFVSVAYQLCKHIDTYRRMSSQQVMRHRNRLVHIYFIICPDARECDIQNEIDAGKAGQVLAEHTSNSHELLDDAIDRQNDIVRESRTIKQLTLLYRQVWELLSRQQARLDTPYLSTKTKDQADEKHSWWVTKAKHNKRMWYVIGLIVMLIVLVTLSVVFAVLANRGKL